jgi:hypothetical protein
MTAELESYCRHQDLLPMSPVASLLPRQRQQIIPSLFNSVFINSEKITVYKL